MFYGGVLGRTLNFAVVSLDSLELAQSILLVVVLFCTHAVAPGTAELYSQAEYQSLTCSEIVTSDSEIPLIMAMIAALKKRLIAGQELAVWFNECNEKGVVRSSSVIRFCP